MKTLAEPFLLVTEGTSTPSPPPSSSKRFLVCMGCGLALFLASFLMFPFSMAAFGLLYSTGSIVFMGSTLFVAPIKQQLDTLRANSNRATCLAMYLCSIMLTLFFALYPGLWFRSMLVLLSVCMQCATLAWYCISYFPRVQAGLRAASMYVLVP
ncbi:hypothetical protein H310_08948 [Aphanomyces invadans]|uniref:Vesicle transport protein n=1 Tax=Aphanomyces invadans TaxID=157072 RepID=A0A024TVN5_9STRA|nr:hypothetical protein H310_08948 [Aphanomyces invadans]ETV98225.1 hypothetical protein H310_08948 [Aphanomyces invadans]|eukprot:XP_008873100.1 hypothetical protein H310_08948 [Aphanomyces invadans]